MRSINSLTNQVIKSLRSLHDRKRRKQSGLFLAEGARIVTEAIDLGWAVRSLIFLEGRENDAIIKPLIDVAAKQGADIVMVNSAILSKISRKDNPQMVLATFDETWIGANNIFANPAGCWVVLDRVRDPGNLGTILRTADAAGAAGVLLVGDCCDAFSVESVRASMGAIFNVPLATMTESDFIASAQIYKGSIIATALPASVDYRQAAWDDPLLLLMGNEQSGLTPALMDVATTLIKMPMLGRSDSLNLAVATGLALYEYRRAQT